MPWFGVVHEDHERMETVEAGAWGEIADTHRGISIGTRKPSVESIRKRSILNWRRRATRQFIEAFIRIISAAKLAYGKRSYFYLLKEGLLIPEVHLQYQKDLGKGDETDDETDMETRDPFMDDGP
ncbi:hypothetical protein PDIDSM_3426 [Penicillium digitatum]|nr:hypothetical protein PDIDSM_3426 [Penicillium digitatum]